jgi:hypothetical protein
MEYFIEVVSQRATGMCDNCKLHVSTTEGMSFSLFIYSSKSSLCSIDSLCSIGLRQMALIPDQPPTKDLHARDLHEGANRRRREQEILYDRLIAALNSQIKAADDSTEKSLMYEAPRFIPMYPHYDVVGYLDYAIRHYRSMGFDVRFRSPNVLYIFWNNPRDIQRAVQQVEKLVDENRKTKMIVERIRGVNGKSTRLQIADA